MVVDCGGALLFDSEVIFYMYANLILLNLDTFMSCLTGGTVDVTAYVVEDKQVLRELHCASGDAVGGTNVDNLFLKLLDDIFGKDVLTKYKRKLPSDWLQLLQSFEIKKHSIGINNPNDDKKMITLTSVYNLLKMFKNAHKNPQKAINNRLKELNLDKKIKCQTDRIRIEETYLTEKVFAGPIKDIVRHLEILFQEKDVKKIDIILLVGGFSECPLLQDEIKEKFPDKKIVNPRDGSIAVMKGAALFGHSAEIIAQKRIEQGHSPQDLSDITEKVIRKSRAYYGIAADIPFKRGEHSPNHKYINSEGRTMCSAVFDCLIKKNQEMEIGKTVFEKTYRAFNNSEANVEIYRSDREVQYCDEEGCRIIGLIHIVYSDDCGDRRFFKVQFHFGFTEKIALAIDLKTQKTSKVKLDCLL